MGSRARCERARCGAGHRPRPQADIVRALIEQHLARGGTLRATALLGTAFIWAAIEFDLFDVAKLANQPLD